jgi:hypothetical protein
MLMKMVVHYFIN